MKTSILLLAALALSSTVRADVPAPSAAVEEGVRVPFFDALALRPGDIAPEFSLPDAAGNRVSSRAWLGQSALLVLSLSAPAKPEDNSVTATAPNANTPLTAEQVLGARRLAEAIKAAAPRLKGRNVSIVLIANGSYFRAISEAMGANFKPAAPPEAPGPDAPNLFILRNDVPPRTDLPRTDASFARMLPTERYVLWSSLVGPSETGVSLTAIDRAGFVRSNESVDDLVSLEPLLVLSGDTSPRVEVGQPAPDFSLRDANGRVRRLSDLRGRKNLLLSFFPKCFTGRCANHLSSLGAERLAFQSVNTEIWAASFDPAEGERGQKAFARQLGLSFPLVPDVSRNLALLYGAASSADQPAPSRMSILIDRDGIVRWIDRALQVRTHGPDVLQKIRELGMK